MRSYMLPLTVMVASVLAASKPDDCVTKGNTVIEYYDYTVTSTVYVTEGAIPTTRSRHSHKPKPTTTPVYVAPVPVYTPPPPPPEPEPSVITVTYPPPTYNAPEPEPQPEPVEQEPAPIGGGFEAECLETHNRLRAQNGAPPLSWSNELASYAESQTGDCVMHHSGGPYGENLAMGYGSAAAAVQGWYDEKSQYSGQGFSMDTGHYTQVVWKSTQQLGCHLRDCGNGPYLMCEYSPPGNVGGGYESNV